MATDPVELVRHNEAETPFASHLKETLRRLADLPPSTAAPYLTLSLDWRPDGSQPNSRAGRIFFDQRRDDLLGGDRYEPHTLAHDSVSADLEQITQYLDGEIDPAVQGLVIVACSEPGVFETVPLSEPLENELVVGPTPSLRALAKEIDDSAAFAVIHADQREAHLIIVEGAARRRDVEIHGKDYPRHQAQGGWSQRRYQMRADERVDAFLRQIAEETEHLLKINPVESIVLAGNEQITSSLQGELSQQLQQRLVGSTRLDIRASEHDVIDAALPIVDEAERQREQHTVERVLNGAGPGGGAVTGAEETLTALQAGQVMTLVINDDLQLDGWADFSLPLYGTGHVPGEHPAGGDSSALTPVPLQDELIRLAVQTGAEIEIVRTVPAVSATEDVHDLEAGSLPQTDGARKLSELGGVAAILRFVLDEDHSTADI